MENCLALSTGDKRQALRDMLAFISENNILHLKDFADHCMSEDAPAGWFEILTERNTLFIKEYIKSNWQKQRIDDSDNYYS
ncbi:Rep family protein [Lacticaseibacillus paracasei]|uniref:Rep family protein n=1 Tax=Lacticaseibacillus paracasei TaxID=1597 RepID=UPI001F027DF7|nr:Rep family protein [Lacticaseibacillus paracasei]